MTLWRMRIRPENPIRANGQNSEKPARVGKGAYAMTVTRNGRLTFTKVDDQTIADPDMEDYH